LGAPVVVTHCSGLRHEWLTESSMDLRHAPGSASVKSNVMHTLYCHPVAVSTGSMVHLVHARWSRQDAIAPELEEPDAAAVVTGVPGPGVVLGRSIDQMHSTPALFPVQELMADCWSGIHCRLRDVCPGRGMHQPWASPRSKLDCGTPIWLGLVAQPDASLSRNWTVDPPGAVWHCFPPWLSTDPEHNHSAASNPSWHGCGGLGDCVGGSVGDLRRLRLLRRPD
jgi:hypothetical protein